jgi:hypothetical protein
MLTTNIAAFLKAARSNSVLEHAFRLMDSYPQLKELSRRAGTPASGLELRDAFMARNAAVLAEKMKRRGLIQATWFDPLGSLDLDLWRRVLQVDLGMVTDQLVAHNGWDRERANGVECRYRRFLYLKAALPGNMASPTAEVDRFWHQHIINTMNYGPDCERVAGQFLHHTFLPPGNVDQAQRVWFTTWISYEKCLRSPTRRRWGRRCWTAGRERFRAPKRRATRVPLRTDGW